MSTFVRRSLKVLLGLLALIVLLVVGVVVALQFDATQDFVARKAEDYLRSKLGTVVRIGKFRTDFRHAVNLDGVYVEDQGKDTLLAVGHLGVNIDLWALTRKEIKVADVELNDGRVRLTRTEPDSVNNYDFIVNAFSDPTAPVDTSASGLKYTIGQVRLTNIYFTQLDQVAGADIRARLGEAEVRMEEVDVDRSIYRVDEAELRRASIAIVQSKTAPEVEEETTEPLTLQFGLNRLALDSVTFSYRNGPAAQYISTRIGQAELTARDIDLPRERIDLDKLTLTNTSLTYAQNEDVPVEQRVVNPAEAIRDLNEAAQKAKPSQPLRWRVTLAESAISGVEVKFDNFNQPRQKTKLPALDYNHLHFTDLTLNTTDFSFTENRTTANLTQLAGFEQSGFRVDSWRARVVYDSVQIRLDSLDLVTPHTHLARTIAIGYQSLDALADVKQLPNLKIEGDFRGVRIGFRDILYLAPDLISTPPFSVNPGYGVRLDGQVAGRVGDFTLRNVAVSGLRGTDLKIRNGRIRGLPEVDGRLYTDIDFVSARTTRADIESLVPRGTIPASISLPPSIAVSGRFKGHPTTLQFTTALTARTSYGDVAFSGDLGAAQANERQPLVGTFAVRNFDVGRLLKNPALGRVAATGRVNATGNLQKPETLVGRVTANVQRADYGGYAYHGIAATVDIDRNLYTIKATSKQDPNLRFGLTGTVNLRDAKVPAYAFNVDLQGANLKGLKLYNGDLRVQGDLTADLRGADANSLNGTFSGRNVVIVRDNQTFALDTLSGNLTQTATRTALTFNSNLADVNLDGNVHLGDLAPELQGHINRYFALTGVKPLPATGDQRFTYSVKLKDSKLAQKLVKDLKEISAFEVGGEYSRAAARLTATGSIPIIRYANYRLDSVKLNVGSDAQRLTYDLRLAQAAQDTTLRLRRPSVTGDIAGNVVNTRVAILGDSANQERLALAGSLREVPVRERGQDGTAYEFRAAADQIINYEKWTAGTDNFVRYYPSGAVLANNLRLTNGRSSLVVQSADAAVPTSPLRVQFTDFQLAELARIVQQQDSLVAGALNGTAEIRNLGTTQALGFVADATITGLVFQKAPIGDLAVKASNATAGRYDVDARLTGGAPAPGQPTNDVQVTGYYLTTGPAPLNFTVDARRLNLKLVEPFSAGQVARTSGALTGQLKVTGAADAPQVRGALTTTADAGFTVPQLGSPFRMVDQTLTFDEKGIAFRDFTVLDSASNKAVVNGYLLTTNLVDYRFDLRATTKDFMAVRSVRTKENPLYYGRLLIDSETHLTGPLTLINVDTRVTVVEGSNLTVESPADDPSVVGREGLVRFFDKSITLDTMLARRVGLDTANVGAYGYNVTAVVTITDRTPFTIIIDPVSGDNLKVRADGTLTTTIDQAGTIGLSGRLTVARGLYRLSLYDLASREFRLQRGSSLTWSGDPYNADLNLTAIYRVEAAPADLLAGQGVEDPTAGTVSRNRLPFRVALTVTDQLAKPTIGFDITLPEDQRGALGGQVEAKLAQLRQPNQTSELSKQVFSLLILGRFVQQNPFQSASSESFVATQLRGSASAVLTDQLQNLTGKYLSGLGVDLGVTNQADYSTGEAKSRTDLNVAVRRQLLNNRLSVRVGTDVPLSGNSGTQATQGASAASNFAGDVSLEYTVVRDGRLRLRAYRQNAFEDIDGAIVRTGAALVFQRDYRDLNELFTKLPEDVKQERRQTRQTEKKDKKKDKEAPAKTESGTTKGPGQLEDKDDEKL